MENVENKILEVLEDVGEKMAPVIKVIIVAMMKIIIIMMTKSTTMVIMINFFSSKIVFQNCRLG